MARHVFFITHPDVVIDPAVPVPDWPLSTRGRERMRAVLGQPWVSRLGSLFCSTERKARDGAAILAEALGLPEHRPVVARRDGTRRRPREVFMPLRHDFAHRSQMISKFIRTVLLATAVTVAVPATFASAQAAPYDGHRYRETLQHRQHAACGHIHSHKARNSCEARVAHDWRRDLHHH